MGQIVIGNVRDGLFAWLLIPMEDNVHRGCTMYIVCYVRDELYPRRVICS